MRPTKKPPTKGERHMNWWIDTPQGWLTMLGGVLVFAFLGALPTMRKAGATGSRLGSALGVSP